MEIPFHLRFFLTQMEFFMKAYEKYFGLLRDIRRDLHQHPELGFQEFRTSEKIREHLSRIPGIRFRTLKTPTGVIADLPGESEEIIALRADIDALPIQEANTHSYVSRTDGRMHGCGHDGHVAILLGAAMMLGEEKRRPYPVRFLFQPAEEVVPSGAPVFLKEGALEGVRRIFGFHLNATSDFGKVGYRHGGVMAGGIAFKVTIRGKGGHSAYPDQCINPIFTASDIVSSLARIRDLIHPMYPANLVPVSMNSGGYGGQIPETAFLEGRMTYLDPCAEEVLRKEIAALVDGCARKNHTVCELELIPKYPITYNDPELGRSVVIPAAESLGLELTQITPSMGSDDFAYYAKEVPAYYMTFGIRKGRDFPIAHTPVFDFDEAILPIGAAQLKECAVRAALLQNG